MRKTTSSRSSRFRPASRPKKRGHPVKIWLREPRPRPAHLHPPLPLLSIVFCGIPVDRLLTVLDHCHDGIIRLAPEPFLIDHQSAAHRIKKAGRLLDEVLVVASCGMRNNDEVIHASQG